MIFHYGELIRKKKWSLIVPVFNFHHFERLLSCLESETTGYWWPWMVAIERPTGTSQGRWSFSLHTINNSLVLATATLWLPWNTINTITLSSSWLELTLLSFLLHEFILKLATGSMGSYLMCPVWCFLAHQSLFILNLSYSLMLLSNWIN